MDADIKIRIKSNGKKQTVYRHVCKTCHNDFWVPNHQKHRVWCSQKCASIGRTHSENTKRRIGQNTSTGKRLPSSIYTMSSRTRVKVIKRLNLSCFVCGWKEGTCDIHHLLEKRHGGGNEHSNLTLLCPNHHRLMHEKKLLVAPTFEEIVGERWKECYYALDNE